MKSTKYFSVQRRRTEHARLMRRLYGDNGGMCRFNDKLLLPPRQPLTVMSCITSVASKDNLVWIEYE